MHKYTIVSLGSQSIKIHIGKPLDKSTSSIDKLNLTVLDVIDQSIKLDTHTLARFQSYRLYHAINRLTSLREGSECCLFATFDCDLWQKDLVDVHYNEIKKDF